MAKFNLYGPFAGVRDALSLLSLLDDKKKLKAVLGVVKALEEERMALNEAIEVYGKAKKMDGLLVAAETKDAEAKRLLGDAEWEAADMRAKAKKDTDEARAKVKLREEAVDAQEKELVKRETELKAELERREDVLVKQVEELAAQEVRLSSQLAGVKERETKYRDRKKALEAIPPL